MRPLIVSLPFAALALAPAFAPHGGVYTQSPAIGIPPGPDYPVGPAAFPRAGGGARTGEVAVDPSGAWWVWWERNRFDFLLPRRVRNEIPVTGADDFLAGRVAERLARSLASRREEWLRERVLPLLGRGAKHADYNVRSSTLVALAKLDGAARLEVLRAGLRDAHAQVRDAALLGLGASASEGAAEVLLSIAADRPEGRAELGGGGSIPSRTRAMAILSLGLAKARGGPDRASEIARASLRDRGKTGRVETATAACVALGLVGDAQAVPDLLRIAGDRDEPTPVRARALAAIGSIGDASARPGITALLADRERFVRGAAVIALGDVAPRGDAEAAGRLATFLAEEEDVGAAGFALIALGRVGGPAARNPLLRELVRGKDARRAFASLGLALAVADAPDAEARRKIEEAFESDASPGRRGAHGIALGLARFEDADPAVTRAFRTSGNSALRGQIAESVALLRSSTGREALLAALASDGSPLGRGRAAFALGFFCDPRDVRPLADALARNSVSSLTGPYSLGLGIHGSEAALEELIRVVESARADPVAIAAATDAIAVAFEADPIPTLHRVARESNYFADPAFLLEALEFLL